MGYIISGIKDAREVKVGDTITQVNFPANEAIQGFEEVKPMVFAGIYPVDTEDFEELRSSMEKLQLNDASLTYEPESSVALGFGFRCGFRNVTYGNYSGKTRKRVQYDCYNYCSKRILLCLYKKRRELIIHNPSDYPDPSILDRVKEPFIRAQIITKSDFIRVCYDFMY